MDYFYSNPMINASYPPQIVNIERKISFGLDGVKYVCLFVLLLHTTVKM